MNKACAVVLTIAGLLGVAASVSAATTSPVITCDQLADKEGSRLRDWVLATQARLPANYKNGNDSIGFLVVRPTATVATASQAIVFFPGTSSIMTDWPYDMLKSSGSGAASLCAAYTLIFFDYPGVGGTSVLSDSGFTFDAVARDVDALVSYVNDTYASDLGTTIDVVHPLGWSLGTLGALKFAGLAAANGYGTSDARQIGSLLLVATKPGGDTQSGGDGHLIIPAATGNQAECVTQVTAQLKNASYYVRAVKQAMFGLMFPYVYTASKAIQGAYSGDDDAICQATSITTSAVALQDGTTGQTIETSCAAEDSTCVAHELAFALNRLVEPYATDGGVPYAVYLQERNIVEDWNYGYCNTAAASWTSSGCVVNPHLQPSTGYTPNSANGGVCQTSAPASNKPSSKSCLSLAHIAGSLAVINAQEDLFIQYVYGEALYTAYQSQVKASLNTYAGSAGHAVLLSDPAWVRGLVVDTLDGAQARLARWKSARAKDAGPKSATPAAGWKKLPEKKPAHPPAAPPH